MMEFKRLYDGYFVGTDSTSPINLSLNDFEKNKLEYATSFIKKYNVILLFLI